MKPEINYPIKFRFVSFDRHLPFFYLNKAKCVGTKNETSLHADIKIFFIIQMIVSYALHFYVFFLFFLHKLLSLKSTFSNHLSFRSGPNFYFFIIVFACQRRILLSAVNLCKQRPRSDPTECWPNLIQTVDTLITLVNVNAPVVATTSWWLHFSGPVVA